MEGENTLLQNTLLRLRYLNNSKDAVIVCNEEHRFTVSQQLEDIGAQAGTIYLEQTGRNTLPAITAAALSMDPDELMLVLPSDHHIVDARGFSRSVEAAKKCARDGALVCFGAVPAKPETGYGYIVAGPKLDDQYPGKGLRSIRKFVEKPGYERAQWYISQGAYWNSGMFLFRAGSILAAVRRFQSFVYYSCREAIRYAEREKNFVKLNREFLLQCPSISIDHGIMEHTNDAVVVGLDSDWNDVGTWNGVWQSMNKTADGNATRGNVYLDDVKNSCVVAETRLVAALGLDNHIVIETADAVLVASRDQAQKVKDLVSKLKAEQKKEVKTPAKVHRPWGYFESLEMSETAQVKRLVVSPGARLSLQRHKFRSEHWVVVSGTAKVVNGEAVFDLNPSQSTFIPVMTLHQLENPGDDPLVIIEVQTGSYFGEDDIERFADDYGRVSRNRPLMAAVM